MKEPKIKRIKKEGLKMRTMTKTNDMIEIFANLSVVLVIISAIVIG